MCLYVVSGQIWWWESMKFSLRNFNFVMKLEVQSSAESKDRGGGVVSIKKNKKM